MDEHPRYNHMPPLVHVYDYLVRIQNGCEATTPLNAYFLFISYLKMNGDQLCSYPPLPVYIDFVFASCTELMLATHRIQFFYFT